MVQVSLVIIKIQKNAIKIYCQVGLYQINTETVPNKQNFDKYKSKHFTSE